MVKINVLRSLADQKTFDATERAAQEFFEKRSKGSYLERHPELGKMKNCQICGTRHFSARVCIPVGHLMPLDTVRDENGAEKQIIHQTRHGLGRFHKHRNAQSLQILERATLLYREDYEPFSFDKDAAGKEALTQAMREKKVERAERRRHLLKIAKASRRANRA